MEKNLTAVEWLVYVVQSNIAPNYIPKEIVEQAREMEKEHIINAWNNAYDKGTRDRLEKVVDPVGDADTYFKETFKLE